LAGVQGMSSVPRLSTTGILKGFPFLPVQAGVS
jgi:hypothetical protein